MIGSARDAEKATERGWRIKNKWKLLVHWEQLPDGETGLQEGIFAETSEKEISLFPEELYS